MFYRSHIDKEIELRASHNYNEIASEWHSILPETHHLRCPDIQALEQSLPEDIDFQYVSVYEQGKLIGVMYLQCLKFGSRHYNHDFLDRVYLKPFKGLILRQEVGILICGNIFRVNFQGFYFVDKEHRSRVFDYLLMYRSKVKSEKDFCGILVKDCSRAFQGSQFQCHGFKAFERDLTMEMEIHSDWNSFDDYKNSLTRKYRQRANKIVKSSTDIQVRDLSLEEIEHEGQRIQELYMNIVSKQALALGILNARYFIQMKKALAENFKVFAYYLDKKLVAFSSHIYYPGRNCMEIHYIGLDYEYNAQYNLYFNILFDGIRTAIELKMGRIEMGRTAREAKASAGAEAVENFNYIWLRPGIGRLGLSVISKKFESQIGEDWKNRSPFKSTESKVVNSEPSQALSLPLVSENKND